jgi:hypothetical protein
MEKFKHCLPNLICTETGQVLPDLIADLGDKLTSTENYGEALLTRCGMIREWLSPNILWYHRKPSWKNPAISLLSVGYAAS